MEDNIFCKKVLFYANNIIYLDEYLYYYRVRDDSNSHLDIMPYIMDIFCVIIDNLNFFYKNKFFSNKERYEILLDNFILYILKKYYCHAPVQVRKTYKSCAKQYLSDKNYSLFLKSINEDISIIGKIFSLNSTLYGNNKHIQIYFLNKTFILPKKYTNKLFIACYRAIKSFVNTVKNK